MNIIVALILGADVTVRPKTDLALPNQEESLIGRKWKEDLMLWSQSEISVQSSETVWLKYYKKRDKMVQE